MHRRHDMHVAPSKILAGMLTFSIVCLLVQMAYQDVGKRLKGLSQALIPLQGSLYPMAAYAAPTEPPGGKSVDVAERDALEGRLLLMTEEVRTLRQRITELGQLRSPGYIPPRLGRLLPASVIASDSLALRNVLRVDRGQAGGVVDGQWVTSAVWLDRGQVDGVQPDRNVFTAESLVGRVVNVFPFMSVVKLLTDPTMRVEVRIARVSGQGQAVEYVPGVFLLEGVGADGMVIRQVDYLLIESGKIREGDLVVVQETADLPREAASLRRVGRIASMQRYDKSPVVYTLRVSPLVDLTSLRNVYVFDPTPAQ